MEVLHHSFLLRELVKRDLQARYSGSMLGFAWSFLQPLWQLALFTFVFAGVMRISLVGERTDNFAIFLFCGLLPWMAIHEGALRSATAVTDNATIVKKLAFPSQILVVTVITSALVHEAIAFAVFLGVLGLMGELRFSGLPLLLLAVPLQIGLTLGLGLLLAAIHVFFRDLVQILGMLFQGWFYFTPIVYPLSLVPEPMERWLLLNPLTTLVTLYRRALLGGQTGWVPGTGSLIALTVVLAGLGWWTFRRLRPAFADEI
jgi:ABC-type polysaccharide/polyol phosphate export permease